MHTINVKGIHTKHVDGENPLTHCMVAKAARELPDVVDVECGFSFLDLKFQDGVTKRYRLQPDITRKIIDWCSKREIKSFSFTISESACEIL